MPLSRSGQVTIEKTPGYLYSKEAPQRMHKMNRDLKLILIVRQPFERTVSCFLQKIYLKEKAGKSYNVRFEDTVMDKYGRVDEDENCIRNSLYANHLVRWLEYFPMKQIHIVDGDNLTKDPAEELQGVERYLGVRHFFETSMFDFNEEKGFYCLRREGEEEFCMNEQKGRPHPQVDGAVKTKLLEYFKQYNELLYRMVGRNFNWEV